MPTIKSSADLRNDYNGVSQLCHSYEEPVFITKNGKGDLAIMSIEAYEKMHARFELYSLLEQGIRDVRNGDEVPFEEGMKMLWSKRKR